MVTDQRLVRIRRVLAGFVLMVLCTGCMYQGEINKQQQNPAFVREELSRVTAAVEQYYAARGYYPIKNSDEAAHAYEKYVIDLTKLVNTQMLSAIPKNAFEQGGGFYYLLIHAETRPAVKLMDLVAIQRVAEVQKAVKDYALANNGKLPIATELEGGFYSMDGKVIKQEALHVRSHYSNQFLPMLLHESGEVLIDYSLDIMKAVQESGQSPEEGQDARLLLSQVSPFSPVRSYPYHWTEGEPKLTAEP